MSNYQTIGGKQVYLADSLARESGIVGTPQDFVGLANSFSCPIGMDPGFAWLLVRRKDLDALIGSSGTSGLDSFQKLVWVSDYDTLTVASLIFVKAVCMSGNITATEPDSLYLTQWADKRLLLAMSGTKESHYQYNCRCPAPPATSGAKLYYDATLSSGSVWTWQTMLDDLWGLLPSGIRGSSPSLPYTPNGTPENFRFVGVSAWQAIGQILDRLRVALIYDPQNDSFSYTRLGTTQSGVMSAWSKMAPRLLLDYFPVEANRSRFPEKIRVTFPTFIQNFGSDADVAQGSVTGTNFATLPAYTIDVATGISGALGGTIMPLWDDMVAVYSGNASGDPQNSTALNSRANEVAGNWVNTVQTSDTRARKRFSGVATSILPGSQINRVLWRDFGDGAMTEYFSSPEIRGNGAENGLAPYDTGRRILEDYPDKCQLIVLTSTSPTSGLYPGKVVRFPPETATPPTVVQDEVVWVQFLNTAVLDTTTYHLGRLMGSIGGTVHPLYCVTDQPPQSSKMVKGHLTAALTTGSSATGTIDVAINCTDSGSITVHDSNSDFNDATGAKHFMAVYNATASQWELIWVAC